jgi:Uma2 family endonuclease
VSLAYDHVGSWTLDDVLALGEDTHQRIELVGGALLMSPAPTVPHQRASRRLAALLEAAAATAGVDVEVLEAVNVVVPDGLLIPDLVVADAAVAADAGVTLDSAGVFLVVEIASPATRTTDRKFKPALYAAAGIESYWRLDLDPAPTLYVGRREDSGYRDQTTVLPGQAAVLDHPFAVTIDPATLSR